MNPIGDHNTVELMVKHLPAGRVGRWGLVVAILLLGLFQSASPPAEADKKYSCTEQNPTPRANYNSPVAADQSISTQADQKVRMEELKKAIVEKNIFRPAKPIIPTTSEDKLITSLGPEPLKNPFTLLGIRQTEQGMRADLASDKPTPRTEEVQVGHVIEDILTILAIEPTYLRCGYNSREVRIAVGDSSTDVWARLAGGEIEYILLGTTATPAGDYVAHIMVTNERTYRTVEVGDMLGDATVIVIEEGYVLLIDSLGNEISIRNPLSMR